MSAATNAQKLQNILLRLDDLYDSTLELPMRDFEMLIKIRDMYSEEYVETQFEDIVYQLKDHITELLKRDEIKALENWAYPC